ncbi:MAG: glycosyltransferase [Planctomycetes bacterium]|nr:glycosyltransferase [Planctomycetota bacterium]
MVVASTWDFPNPSHAYAYQEMLGFLDAGYDVRVFMGERRPAQELAARFRPLLDRTVCVETLASIHERDLRHLDRGHPGKVDTFLRRVAEVTGRSLGELRAEPLVLRACTFTRLVELSRARYLQSWFFYDQSFMAMFAAQVLGIPRGISCHVDHVLADHPFKLVPLQLQTADLVLAISERTRDELVRLGGAGCADRILVKRIGVDGTALRSLRQPRPVGEAFELVSVCRIEPKKGLVTLIEACELLRRRGLGIRIRLVGGVDPSMSSSADYAARVRRRVTELGLSDLVSFTGALAHDLVPDVLAAAHAFVAPYVEVEGGDKDGIPTAMVEAMAAGLPVIASAVGSIGEAVVEGEQGLLVPPGDAVALAAAIERLAGDERLRERLAAGAARRFDREYDCRVTDVALHDKVRAFRGSPNQVR